MLDVTLLTRGSPAAVSGGHLYHQRMRSAAARHDARLALRSLRIGRNPFVDVGDVVLIDSLAAAAVAPWLHRHRGPIAAIVHQQPGGVDHGPARIAVQRRLDAFVYRRCAVVLAVSAHVAEHVRAACALPDVRVRVVSPGRDLPPARTPSGTEPMRAGRRAAVLCVANWYPNKGIAELLAAVARLPDDAVTLHLVGRTDVDRRYSARVTGRLAADDLRGRVVVHGPVAPADLSGLYDGADVFALASVSEAYGTVYAEALTAGLPVVGWRSGNLPYLVDDHVHGRLVAPGDVAGLARALQALADDPGRRAELATAARARGATLPTWDDTADAFFGALSQAARSRG